MSGTQLGFGLAELAQQLVDASEFLMSLDLKAPLSYRKDSERLHEAVGVGDSRLPRVRTRLLRYANLVVAKQRPELESRYDIGDEDAHKRDFSISMYKHLTIVETALAIQVLCIKVIECEDREVEGILVDLDLKLEEHAHQCSLLWPKFIETAQELELQQD